MLKLESETGSNCAGRLAEVCADGRVCSLHETSADVWSLDHRPRVAQVIEEQPPTINGSGLPVEVDLTEQAKLEELLADGRHADIATLLGPRATYLAEAFAQPACIFARLTRMWRVGDGVAIDRVRWVSAPCGSWLVDDPDLDSERAVTTFTRSGPS